MKAKFSTTIVFISLLFFSCSANIERAAIIRIKGSDTMLLLTEELAKAYMKLNPNISIYVEGGGTTSGIRSLINNEIDIAAASRLLIPSEAQTLAEYYGSLGMYFLIAKDALSIYTNPDNQIKNLSLRQLKDIFTCSIKNWKVLSGEDAEILRIIRTPASGTYLYFKQHILEDQDYCEDVVTASTTNEVINIIKKNKNAIGYGGIGYGRNEIHHLDIDGISPTEENARNDIYPITRYLHLLTTRTPSGPVRHFIDWVLTPDGQKVIEHAGFISLWDVTN
ncbi:MAG: phosphate ABC transporter substrate-binding protein [Melioribacteraceae bacterium]|nr:phosphate ABC transporter substrate-binding protein [Melioribacteraceae bacterium]